MNRFDTISIKILDRYFEDSIKLILKFICKKNSQNNFERGKQNWITIVRFQDNIMRQ